MAAHQHGPSRAAVKRRCTCTCTCNCNCSRVRGCSATSPPVRCALGGAYVTVHTWTCRYRLYFIAAPLALSMSCRPLTRKSQGPPPSPVQSSVYAAKDTLLYATRTRRVCPLCRDSSNLADRSSLQHVPSAQFDNSTIRQFDNPTSLAAHVSVSSAYRIHGRHQQRQLLPARLARDLPVPFSAQALRLAATNHPPLQD